MSSKTNSTFSDRLHIVMPVLADQEELTCADTGYNLKDLMGTMDVKGGWRERV